MNERIKQLLGQAYDEAVPETWTTLSSEQLGRIYDKFAELIVERCLSMIENEAAQYAEPVWAFELINDIKEHFGVEE